MCWMQIAAHGLLLWSILCLNISYVGSRAILGTLQKPNSRSSVESTSVIVQKLAKWDNVNYTEYHNSGHTAHRGVEPTFTGNSEGKQGTVSIRKDVPTPGNNDRFHGDEVGGANRGSSRREGADRMGYKKQSDESVHDANGKRMKHHGGDFDRNESNDRKRDNIINDLEINQDAEGHIDAVREGEQRESPQRQGALQGDGMRRIRGNDGGDSGDEEGHQHGKGSNHEDLDIQEEVVQSKRDDTVVRDGFSSTSGPHTLTTTRTLTNTEAVDTNEDKSSKALTLRPKTLLNSRASTAGQPDNIKGHSEDENYAGDKHMHSGLTTEVTTKPKRAIIVPIVSNHGSRGRDGNETLPRTTRLETFRCPQYAASVYGLHSDPTNCRRFYLCVRYAGRVPFTLRLHYECPKDTQYDNGTQNCTKKIVCKQL